MKRGDLVTARIERLEPSGRGVALIEGQPVLIDGGLPEQIVKLEILRIARGAPQPRLANARIVALISRGPDEPDPTIATTTGPICPGAPWYGVPLTVQTRWKQDLAATTLRAIAEAVPPGPIADALTLELLEPLVPSPQTEGYRNKVEYSCGYGRIERIPDPRHPASGRTMPEGFDPAVGFHPPGNWQLVQSFDACPILPRFMPEMRRRLEAMCLEPGPVDNYRPWCDIGCRRSIMLRGGAGFDGTQALFILKTGGDTAVEARALDQFRAALGDLPGMHLHCMQVEEGSHPRGTEAVIDLAGGPYLTMRFCDRIFRVRPGSFFQTNIPAAEQLVRRIGAWLRERPCHTLWDLYCGAGSIGLSLAGHATRLVGIEVVPAAIEDARENARENGIADATFTAATAEQSLAEQFAAAVPDLPRSVAVVDPPRAGLHPKALKAIAAAPLAGLAYVACNPVSLVHDLPALFAAGYRLERLIPYDFFPHTPHLELLALLRRA
ncbi:MAG TPA: methyltransferase domain-containing protein [Planctomycetota bacterium]|nr:methyltransferase domain-containing protein [Planctomycetota bacterium]